MSPSLSAITGNHKMATVPNSMGYICRGLGSMTNSQPRPLRKPQHEPGCECPP